jgi:hypothetical protein
MSGDGGRGRDEARMRMRRRDFLAAVAIAATSSPRARAAQRRDPVIGYLYHGTLSEDPKAFWKGLADQGYVKGRNLCLRSTGTSRSRESVA